MKTRAAAVLAWLRGFRAHPLFLLALAACAGIGAAEALSGWPPWAWLSIIAAAALLVLKRPDCPSLLVLCAASFAFAHHANDRDPVRERLAANVRAGGAVNATVTGVVDDAPEPDATGTNFSFP